MEQLAVYMRSLGEGREYLIIDAGNFNTRIFLRDESLSYSKADAALEEDILKDWYGERTLKYEEPLFGWYVAKVIID